MKRLKLILPIIIIAFLIVGCESKKIRNAEEFMILEDWENCIANLKAEITDNPRNLKVRIFENLLTYLYLYSQYCASLQYP